MVLTQPFGTNQYGVDYTALKDTSGQPLKLQGHNGWDLSSQTGTEVYAVCDGALEVLNGGTGYGNEARIYAWEKDEVGATGYEIVYGHLQSFYRGSGLVRAGEIIAHSDNTGFSTGPHLHLGIRRRVKTKAGTMALNYDNGYLGYLDPTPFFAPDVFDLPVDKRYGERERHMTELQFYAANAYFFKTQRRLMTTREKHALCWGYWDLRTVLDPAMFTTWTSMTKPAAIKAGIIKQL
jgi:murein DD-endopeptidase MepM/ murein hydrolase activator NlpD